MLLKELFKKLLNFCIKIISVKLEIEVRAAKGVPALPNFVSMECMCGSNKRDEVIHFIWSVSFKNIEMKVSDWMS